jgi:hypothetical protein
MLCLGDRPGVHRPVTALSGDAAELGYVVVSGPVIVSHTKR